MGMKILATRGSSSRADLEALLRGSDVISVHCPLTERTRGLIRREELRLMKQGVILVNYSRGEVLDEEVGSPSHCARLVLPCLVSCWRLAAGLLRSCHGFSSVASPDSRATIGIGSKRPNNNKWKPFASMSDVGNFRRTWLRKRRP
jgi:hypothetical protein